MFFKKSPQKKIPLFVLSAFALQLFFSQYSWVLASDGFFKDTPHHWAEDSIEILKNNCHVQGYLDSAGNPLHLFKPDSHANRAELVKMLTQCRGDLISVPASNPFWDVNKQEWFGGPIAKAKALGWVSGYPDSSFRPTLMVSRAEALKIILLSKFNKEQITGGDLPFSDVSKDAWYAQFVAFAHLKGYVEGYDSQSANSGQFFAPNQFISRAEIATLIVRIYGLGNQVTSPAPAPSPIPTPVPTPTPTPPVVTPVPTQNTTGNLPRIGSCQIFPADNAWNRDISKDALDPKSESYIASILKGKQFLHPDFGGNGEYGIPYNVVSGTQLKVPITVVDYPEESDPGPYPIPLNAKIEGGSDRHVLTVDADNCKLYELWTANQVNNGWEAGSAAIFDLTSNALRPAHWTSADAAGLPVFAGLVRYDEVAAGEINHALRFTVSVSQKGYIHPATHQAGKTTDPNVPPMGLRLRLKANFDTSKFTGQSKVILEALKKYGMIVADNGSDWFISGSMDSRWNDEDLRQLKSVPGSSFEVVQGGPILH